METDGFAEGTGPVGLFVEEGARGMWGRVGLVEGWKGEEDGFIFGGGGGDGVENGWDVNGRDRGDGGDDDGDKEDAEEA